MADERKPAKPHRCSHPEAVGVRWGDPITPERQAELQAILDAWAAATDHGDRKGPFDLTDVPYSASRHLTGAAVGWLAARSGLRFPDDVPNLHLEGAHLYGEHLEGAQLGMAHLEGANFKEAHLEGARLTEAYLAGAGFGGAHLQGAGLGGAQLEGAFLRLAHLEGAYLSRAHLEGAELRLAHLEGTDLTEAHLEGAILTSASFDKTSRLNAATLTGASFDQVTFDSVNLTVVDWSLVPVLGDELRAWQDRYGSDAGPGLHDTMKRADVRLEEFKAAVRANSVLAVTLRAQGLAEDADRYAYRAQVLQRQVLRRSRRPGRAFGSWLLDLVSGYGYKPMRSVFTYLLVVAAFTIAYFFLGGAHGQSLTWNEALVVSMTAFHGRGFFGSAFQPGDPQAAVAAVEALVGLLIEITFIATFTQRFFAR